MEILYLLIGILSGGIAGFFCGLRIERKLSDSKIEERESFHKESMLSLRNEFDITISKLQSELKASTEEILKKRQEEFSESSAGKLDQILKPLRQNIKDMRDAVTANTEKSAELGGKLEANLNTLFSQTAAAQASAEKLANALKGSNQTQGIWGETLLTELLETQGLKKGIHFDTQVILNDEFGNRIKNSDGNYMKPDVVIHLDKERDVIVDSKVSLSAYLEYVNALEESEKEDALQRHIRSIESHIAELVRKNYAGYKAWGKRSLGFVIMFVPNAPALLLAMEARPDLWRKAMEKKIYIADEQTLYAALKIINLTWQQIAQVGNHEKVYRLADEMLDRVGAFMKYFMEIGQRLDSAKESFNEGMKKLKDGGQSIPGTCKKLRELGAKTTKSFKGVETTLLGEEN